MARALRLTRIVIVRSIMGSRRTPPPVRGVVGVFESCMLKTPTERGVSLRRLAAAGGRQSLHHHRSEMLLRC